MSESVSAPVSLDRMEEIRAAVASALPCDGLGGCGHPAYRGDGGHSPSCPAYWRGDVVVAFESVADRLARYRALSARVSDEVVTLSGGCGRSSCDFGGVAGEILRELRALGEEAGE